MSDRPVFEVMTAATNAAARRLTTASYVAARMDDAPASAVLEGLIDDASDAFARYCRLARHGTTPPTFASETLRGTWNATCDARGKAILLPWRTPVTAISAVVENGIALSAADYQLADGAMLKRMSGSREACWSSGAIVVTYLAGWVDLSANAPLSLQSAVAEQVKYLAAGTDANANPRIRSYTTPDLEQVAFNVPGGSSVTEEGLLKSAARAFDDLRVIRL